MTKKMLIDAAHQEEIRVCLLKDGKVEDFDFESSTRKPLRGNIYLARVTRVEPSLQAAFVEYGGNRHGFLAFNEIHPDYYQIPVSDREAIQAAEAEEARLAAALDLGQRDDEDEVGENEVGEDEEGDALSADDSVSTDADQPEDIQPEDNGANESAASPEGDDEDDDPAQSSVSEDEQDDRSNEVDEDSAAPAALANPTPEISADIAPQGDEQITEADADIASDPSIEEDDAPTQNAADSQDAGVGPSQEAAEPVEDDGEEDDSNKEEKRAARSKRAELLERYKEARRKHARLVRSYKIQEVIKRRQILLIQVVKEERGNNGAALTTYLSLAGRYCVLMPNTARGGGISRKIPNSSDRKRLRRVVDGLEVSQGMGLIIRTAGAKRTKAEIKRDYEYLSRLWENIRSLTLKSIAPSLIYEEASLIKRAIRDLYDKDISKILVDGESGYREAKDFMKMLMPSHAKNVQPYKEKTPLFVKFDVEKQLDAMYQPMVRLKSGGYLIINQTEALIAIDVNSGKATRERNIELTALKTNLEAAKEAARQFRLRDLAGLIVIDFIDMEEHKNNRSVEKKLKDALKNDRARIQVGRISNFGLLEMSRQRRRSGIIDGTTHACPTCAGAGAVRSHEMAALRILRAIESEAIAGRAAVISVRAALDVTLYMLNNKRAWLRRIEEDFALTIEVEADQTKAGDQYEIEKRGAPRPQAEATVVTADQPDMMDDDTEDSVEPLSTDEIEEATASTTENGGKKRRRRRKRKKADPATSAQNEESVEELQNADAADGEITDETETAGEDAGDEEKPKKRRRRGRRGGRRNGRKIEGAASAESPAENGELTPQTSEVSANNVDPSPQVSDGAPNGAPHRTDDGAMDREGEIAPVISEKTREAAPEPASDTAAPDIVAPEVAATDSSESDVQQSKAPRKGWWTRAIGG